MHKMSENLLRYKIYRAYFWRRYCLIIFSSQFYIAYLWPKSRLDNFSADIFFRQKIYEISCFAIQYTVHTSEDTIWIRGHPSRTSHLREGGGGGNIIIWQNVTINLRGGGGISGPYDVTAFLIFLHKYFSLKHVLGDTQHVCMMIISNHAKPCFLEQLGEVPFVDMVFMHEIEVNKSFGFVLHLQSGADKNHGSS